MTAGDGARQAARDRRVLVRASLAGLAVWVVLGAAFTAALAPGGGAAVLAGVSWSLAAGALVAAGWASVALALDLLRQRPVRPARVGWTLALALVAVVAPLFAAAATAVR